jgi:dTDP-4-dehydrorhamnose reductase
VNDYGAQKVEAESKVLRALPSATILRISLQYGDHSGLNPSSKNVLDAIKSGNAVELDNLQIRSPTYVKNTAKDKFYFFF